MGVVLGQQNPNTAIPIFDKVLRIESNNVEAQYNKGNMYNKLNQLNS